MAHYWIGIGWLAIVTGLLLILGVRQQRLRHSVRKLRREKATDEATKEALTVVRQLARRFEEK